MSAVGKTLRVVASKNFLESKNIQNTNPEALSFSTDQNIIWFNNKSYGIILLNESSLKETIGEATTDNISVLSNLFNSGIIPLIQLNNVLYNPITWNLGDTDDTISFLILRNRDYIEVTLSIIDSEWKFTTKEIGKIPEPTELNDLQYIVFIDLLNTTLPDEESVNGVFGAYSDFYEAVNYPKIILGMILDETGEETTIVRFSVHQGPTQWHLTSIMNKTDLITVTLNVENEKWTSGSYEIITLADAKNIEAVYTPNQTLLDLDVTMPSTHGGLGKKKVSEVKGMTFSQMFDAILFPDVQPSVTGPSASITFVNYSGTLKEVGEVAPQESNFKGSFSRGSTSYDGPRAGEQILEQSWIYVGGDVNNRVFPEKVTLGSTGYRYHASYKEGPLVHTLQGNVATISPNPLPAGSVNSSIITVSGTYPYYCNGASASTSSQETTFPSSPQPNTKLPLISWNADIIGCKFASEAATGTRLIFQFPSLKTVTSVQFYNTVSGAWETFASSNYTISDDGTKNIQGEDINYKKLTTVGGLSGNLQLRFNLSNS